MNRRDFFKAAAAGAALSTGFRADATEKQPNIVFVLADDMGYGDVRAFNPSSKVPTPHLDRVAAGGMRFTDAHSGSAVCTPTRYGVLTGRYSWRTPMKSGVLNGYSRPLIEPGQLTVAEMLQQAGYRTGCVGKWHLGMDLPRVAGGGDKDLDPAGRVENGPHDRGFDYNFNVLASLDMPPYVYVENDRFAGVASDNIDASKFPKYWRAGAIDPEFSMVDCLDQLTDKAVDFIAESAQGDAPFFLYFPLTAPHKPVLPHPRYHGKSGVGDYGDFLIQVDDVIGRVDQALADVGAAEDTLFIMTSDNGSFMYRLQNAPERHGGGSDRDHVDDASIQAYDTQNHRANLHWRGTKADIWDGGHRVPYIARWPKRVRAGSDCDTPICLTDLMATCADAAGIEVPEGAAEDSYSILPWLEGKRSPAPRPPVVHHSINGTLAMREGDYKLIFGSGSGGRGTPSSKPWSEPYQLYHFGKDPWETKNLIDEPEHASVLARFMDNAEKLGILAEREAAEKKK